MAIRCGERADDTDRMSTKLLIVRDAALYIRKPIIRRQDLNNQNRWIAQDAFMVACLDKNYIRDILRAS